MSLSKSKVYIFHTDPGHGWLAVKMQEIVDLDILSKISSCSYYKGNTVYLEEDCDARIFINAMKEQHAIEVQYRTSYQQCTPIRSYSRFQSG